ncbi:thioredoxin domain-containing protein [candidate division KSB1 bacterium]|nr:thioredoxin domain-containing protein [candidate division KSB1 bacterium]
MNQLQFEKSPYLLQHATNPVNWYPWGEAAFTLARTQNKPVFLSIGYATCHWCHVMEQESFTDPEVAALLNRIFIPIKVDREERPDLDHLYMTVCQMMTGSGGWPLTIILTPAKAPFFAGTYFPKDAQFGRIGLLDLIERIELLWQTRQPQIQDTIAKVQVALQERRTSPAVEVPTVALLQQTYTQLQQSFDAAHGGFSPAPKFPTPHNLLFLLRYWHHFDQPLALQMVEKTLQAMRAGGIFDQVGFGLHRYATDKKWLVPHFEKMLYDQALLTLVYLEAYQATNQIWYANTAREILSYVLRDLTAPTGAFYSAEDADSEGEEGKYYLWTQAELAASLATEDFEFARTVFGIKEAGNFADPVTQTTSGVNILHLPKSLEEFAIDFSLPAAVVAARLGLIRERLLSVRRRRIPPLKDDKILVDWNGLMIAALARAAQIFNDQNLADAAKKAVQFILTTLQQPDGRLWRRYRDGAAGIPANLDDYAFFIWGLLELYEATFKSEYLQASLELNATLLEHFWDQSAGGFFFSADDAEALLVRQKMIYDGALPSGNSVAQLNLIRLSRFTGRTDLAQYAQKIIQAFLGTVRLTPMAYTFFMSALDWALTSGFEIVIAGEPNAEDTQKFLHEIRQHYLPNKVVVLRPTAPTLPSITELAPFTRQQTSLNGRATVYVCRDYQCALPTQDVREFRQLLKRRPGTTH